MICRFRQAPGRFLRPLSQTYTWTPPLRLNRGSRCDLHVDGRNRTSNFWMPVKKEAQKTASNKDEDRLESSNFISKAYSGVYHMLPLGLRVQDKIEKLIDRHMQSLGASKASLSSLSGAALWEKSGRLNENSEVLRVEDRRDSRFILAPTHEEEITQLVNANVRSYKDLPVRAYQISRKYRDEARPRQGLLRAKEFVMKDLYTFDHTTEQALQTYDDVKLVYKALFDELKVPILTATADSGNMGGNLSHEFHIPSLKGEDTVITCSNCDSVFNEEVSSGMLPDSAADSASGAPGFEVEEGAIEKSAKVSTGLWMGLSKDKSTLVRVWYPKFTMVKGSDEPVAREINVHAIKAITKAAGIDLITTSDNALPAWAHHINLSKETPESPTKQPQILDIYDSLVRPYEHPPYNPATTPHQIPREDVAFSRLDSFPGTPNKLTILKAASGDPCPTCSQGTLTPTTTIELGHTFHLGTRYSEPLGASVYDANNKPTPMQMGCHGIGVSRLIAAVADALADSRGLNWPAAIAPYHVAIVNVQPPSQSGGETEEVYDILSTARGAAESPLDVIIHDRNESFGYRLNEADLIGFPVIVVIGKAWKSKRQLEVQARRLGVKQDVPVDELVDFVRGLLAQL